MPSLLDRFKANALTTASEDARREKLAREMTHRESFSQIDPRAQALVDYARVTKDPSYVEPGLGGGVPTETVTGLGLSPLDVLPAGVLAKAGALAKAFGVPLAAALGATGIGSRASQGAKLSGLAEAFPKQRGIFAGENARNADLELLQIAKQMRDAGIPDTEIFRRTTELAKQKWTNENKPTGWFFGMPDKKARYEVSDDKARYIGAEKGGSDYANAVIEHPEFFNAYPGASGMKVEEVPGAGGSYLANPSGAYGRIEIGSEAQSPISVAAHELQHAVQQREGFARGGSPEQFRNVKELNRTKAQAENIAAVASDKFNQLPEELKQYARIINRGDDISGEAYAKISANPKAKALWADYIVAQRQVKELLDSPQQIDILTPSEQYRSLAGESESRLTQARLAMTPEERAASYPPSMFDVPSEQQIVRYGEGREMSVPKVSLKESSNFLSAKSDAGEVGGHIRNGELHISHAEVSPELRGTGEGIKLYQSLIDDAHSRGLKVFSDSTVEGDAVNVYNALQKRGYGINNTVAGTLEGGSVYGRGATSPAFEVAPKSTAEQYAELLKSTDETLKGGR